MSYQNILIDPILTNYASPFNFIGVKRFSEVPINPENIPDINILLISHNHYDHLDYQSIKKILLIIPVIQDTQKHLKT